MEQEQSKAEIALRRYLDAKKEAQPLTKGRVCINVSDDLMQQAGVKIRKPVAGVVYWDAMEVKELLDTWQSLLQLPDGYTIIGSFFSIVHYQWMVIVESDALPIPKEGEMLPLLSPMYQRTADGKVSLVPDSLKLKE
jgi:hypothetical protein